MHSKSLPILYSFRRCPYAMRARLALHVSGIVHELREVHLRHKPACMLEASPKGSVPVLVLPDGRVIDESWDIMLWALQQNDPENWLGPQNQYRDEALPLVRMNDSSFKLALDHYKYADRYPEQPQADYRSQGELFLQQLETRLTRNRYLLGPRMSIADAAIFPFIRQFAGVDQDWFNQSPYPRLRNWTSTQLQSDRLTAVMQKHPVWKAGDRTLIAPGNE